MGQQSMGAQQGFPGPQPMGPPRNFNGYQDNGFSRPWNAYNGSRNTELPPATRATPFIEPLGSWALDHKWSEASSLLTHFWFKKLILLMGKVGVLNVLLSYWYPTVWEEYICSLHFGDMRGAP